MMMNRIFFYLCFLSSVLGGRHLFGDGLVYALPSITGIQPGTVSPPPYTYGGYYPVSYGTYQYQSYGAYGTSD